jgi:hypothetical protein
MEDCWIGRAVEDATPAEFRKRPSKVQLSPASDERKQRAREFMRRLSRESERLIRQREKRVQCEATAAPAEANGPAL